MRVLREDAVWARTAVPRAPAPLTGRDPAEFALRGNAGRRREAALPAEAFKEFFRIAYQSLLRDAIFAGGCSGSKSLPEAQREVLACMVDIFTPQEITELLGNIEAAVRTEGAATIPGRRPDER